MVFRASITGYVRGLPENVEPEITISAPAENYGYTETVDKFYTQQDYREIGVWTININIRQTDGEGSQWGLFTVTITAEGCYDETLTFGPSGGRFDILQKKWKTAISLSDGTESWYVEDIDAREMLDNKADRTTAKTEIIQDDTTPQIRIACDDSNVRTTAGCDTNGAFLTYLGNTQSSAILSGTGLNLSIGANSVDLAASGSNLTVNGDVVTTTATAITKANTYYDSATSTLYIG